MNHPTRVFLAVLLLFALHVPALAAEHIAQIPVEPVAEPTLYRYDTDEQEVVYDETYVVNGVQAKSAVYSYIAAQKQGDLIGWNYAISKMIEKGNVIALDQPLIVVHLVTDLRGVTKEFEYRSPLAELIRPHDPAAAKQIDNAAKRMGEVDLTVAQNPIVTGEKFCMIYPSASIFPADFEDGFPLNLQGELSMNGQRFVALALDSPFSFTDAATGGKVVGTINGRMILKKRSLAVAWGLIQVKGVNQTTDVESTSTTVITESDFGLIPRI